MTPEQRDGARERFQTWQRLPPEQRALIASAGSTFSSCSPEQQQRGAPEFHAFSRLPPQQRAQLRERWLHATPQQRQQMLQHQRLRRGLPPFRRFPSPKRAVASATGSQTDLTAAISEATAAWPSP